MAYFSSAVITNVGNNLLQAYNGGATLVIEGAVGGTGTVDVAALMAQTALKNQKQTFSIISRVAVTGGLKLGLRITSTGITTEYVLNQIGIKANVNSGTSTLLALFQDSTGVTIPTYTDKPDFAFTFYAVIMMDNTGTLSVTIDTSAVATQGDINDAMETHNADPDAHPDLLAQAMSTTGDGSNVTAAFAQAAIRENIISGEKLSVIFGKVMKWLADIGTAAFKAAGNASGNVPVNGSGLGTTANVPVVTDSNGNLVPHAGGALGTAAFKASGSANGVAELDSSGLVPSSQLPSFVDDVLEYADYALLPASGSSGKIYVTLDDNITYRWSGSAYVEISKSLALGETEAAAYRGDRGKAAYDHSLVTSGNPHGVTAEESGATPDTNELTAETAIADGDAIPFYDTSAGGHRKTLWSNIKSVLKTYFDTLYNNYSLPTATDSTLGGIKVGENLTIDEGVLSAVGGGGVKVARFVVGTSVSGWTESDCDYLCDGTADDVEINAALTELPSTGGEIVILDGTYNITAKIAVTKSGTTIRGSGRSTILKRMWSSAVSEGVVNVYSTTGCRLENFSVDGTIGSYTVSYNYGIFFDTSDDCVSRDVCVFNARNGISLYNSNKCVITACYLYEIQYNGITVNAGSYNLLTGNKVINTTVGQSAGVILYTGTYNRIEENHVERFSKGIYLSSAGAYNLISGNSCKLISDVGIFVESSMSTSVIGNVCADGCSTSNGSGIKIKTSNGCLVTGNFVTNDVGMGCVGVKIETSTNCTVTGNTLNGNISTGLYITGSSQITACGNSLDNNVVGLAMYTSINCSITGNCCIRDDGEAGDYESYHYTIKLGGTGNNYNIVADNNCRGKAIVDEGGTGNSLVNNMV